MDIDNVNSVIDYVKHIDKEQNDYNKFMIERYWGIYPFIFSTDAHYLNKDEREIHKAFLNSKSSSDREVDSFYRYAYIMSQQEVRDLMPYISDEMFAEMVNNTKKIASMCQFYELEQPKVIARVKYDHMDEYEEDLAFFEELDRESHPFLSHYLFDEDNEADKYLGRLIAHGFVQKYQDKWDIDTYFNRLEEELWTIKTISDNIIMLGNKSRRKEIKHRIWMNSNICDCCGKPLDKFPWKTKYGLCDECNDFHYKKDKVIWRNNIIKIKEEKLNRICWR